VESHASQFAKLFEGVRMRQSDDATVKQVARWMIAQEASRTALPQRTVESWVPAAHRLGTYVETTTTNARSRHEVAATPEHRAETSVSSIANSIAFPHVESELRFWIDSLRGAARQTELKRRRVEAQIQSYERGLVTHSIGVQQESAELRLDQEKLQSAIDKMLSAIQGKSR